MNLVGNPRPVNPRPGLAATAAENGWPVLQVIGSAQPQAPVVAPARRLRLTHLSRRQRVPEKFNDIAARHRNAGTTPPLGPGTAG